MKKYFNKGLIYQWFNSAKMIILLGVIVWGTLCRSIIESKISDTASMISNGFENYYLTFCIMHYAVLGVIFSLIHFVSQGINKRNNSIFLTSAPYTKKQIKYNEFICLMATLIVFIIVMIYMNMLSYMRHYELIAIFDGYFKGLLIEVIRMILFGTMGILLLLIIDSMFVNTILGIICMLTVFPVAVMSILIRILSIFSYLPGGDEDAYINAADSINSLISYDLIRKIAFLTDTVPANTIGISNLIMGCVISAVIIAILLGVYYISQKKYKIENNTKMFTSRINEKIMVLILSVGLGALASDVFISSYIYNLFEYDYAALFGMNLVKGLGADLGLITVVAFVSYRLINKLLKNIEE